jgi:transcriptional regulator with XRE-family HTH domain
MQLKDRKLLARLMAIQGISARQLAKEAGWRSHTYLQRLLSGEVSTLKTDPAALIALRLQVPQDVLFDTRTSTNPEHTDDPSRTRTAS